MSEHVSPEAAEELVKKAARWYSTQLMKEQRTGGPAPERLRVLQEGLAACGVDLEALTDASPEEVDEIAARYAARPQELGGQ
ncbi:hypothetical protein [Streptomyces sp. NPDC055632]